MATHEPQKNYLISIHFLKVLLGLGVDLQKIHRIFRFKQDSFYKSYIEKNIELRKSTSNDFERNLYKLYNNVLFGRRCMNCRNYSEQVRLITSKKTVYETCQFSLVEKMLSDKRQSSSINL